MNRCLHKSSRKLCDCIKVTWENLDEIHSACRQAGLACTSYGLSTLNIIIANNKKQTESVLEGQWLVFYPSGGFGIVNNTLFKNNYELIGSKAKIQVAFEDTGLYNAPPWFYLNNPWADYYYQPAYKVTPKKEVTMNYRKKADCVQAVQININKFTELLTLIQRVSTSHEIKYRNESGISISVFIPLLHGSNKCINGKSGDWFVVDGTDVTILDDNTFRNTYEAIN